MSLLSAAQLTAIQKMGETAMKTDVAIYKRISYAADDSNPDGDDTVTYATTPIRVKGWLVPDAISDFGISGGMVQTAGSFRLRIPVGTDVDHGDRVVIRGATYRVSDETAEQSWPEWLTVNLRRAQ